MAASKVAMTSLRNGAVPSGGFSSRTSTRYKAPVRAGTARFFVLGRLILTGAFRPLMRAVRALRPGRGGQAQIHMV